MTVMLLLRLSYGTMVLGLAGRNETTHLSVKEAIRVKQRCGCEDTRQMFTLDGIIKLYQYECMETMSVPL